MFAVCIPPQDIEISTYHGARELRVEGTVLSLERLKGQFWSWLYVGLYRDNGKNMETTIVYRCFLTI